jgi:hypothetical protein
MKPAIETNEVYNMARRQRGSICPVGQSDQAEINAMKLGNVLRQNNRRAAAPARPAFSTVWTRHFAATA